MDDTRAAAHPTRKLLKMFGVNVTDYEERTRALLDRYAKGGHSAGDRQAILQEAAELTADLNHWLREMTNHLLQVQSDFLSRLVAEPSER